MESSKKVTKHKAEELLARFRSKEDIYRYMTQQGKLDMARAPILAVNVFLPSMKGTKLSFMRDILSETKLHLKQNEVIRLEIPQY